MQWRLSCITVLLLMDTLIGSTNKGHDAHLKTRRAIADNFDILLNIYKLNPLKESNVFKTFSNSILLSRPDARIPDLNFDSNESTEEKRMRMRAKFKQIEDAIHVTQLSKSIVKRPSLNIQDSVEEDIKTPSDNDDIVYPKQETPFGQEYRKLMLNLRSMNKQSIESVQNKQITDEVQPNESSIRKKLTLYTNNIRIMKDPTKSNYENEVVVMR